MKISDVEKLLVIGVFGSNQSRRKMVGSQQQNSQGHSSEPEGVECRQNLFAAHQDQAGQT